MEAPSRKLEKTAIVFPKVPVYVTAPVAPLYQDWADIAEAYEEDPTSLRNAWLYLGHHPAFWTLTERPGGFHVTGAGGWYQSIESGVEEDNSVWIEIQPSLWPDDTIDNFETIDIMAPTYEEAVTMAASAVHRTYHNDREFLRADTTDRWLG